jgi:hypothetical protein
LAFLPFPFLRLSEHFCDIYDLAKMSKQDKELVSIMLVMLTAAEQLPSSL